VKFLVSGFLDTHEIEFLCYWIGNTAFSGVHLNLKDVTSSSYYFLDVH
jgi:hypothetical protein